MRRNDRSGHIDHVTMAAPMNSAPANPAATAPPAMSIASIVLISLAATILGCTTSQSVSIVPHIRRANTRKIVHDCIDTVSGRKTPRLSWRIGARNAAIGS